MEFAGHAPASVKARRVWFAISTTNRTGVWYPDHDRFTWLSSRIPAAVLLDSIRVCDFTENADALRRLSARLRLAGREEASRFLGARVRDLERR